MAKKYLSSSFVETLNQYLTLNNYTDADFLQEIESIRNNHPYKVPRDTFVGLLNRVKNRYPKPAFGFQVGRCTEPSHYGIVGYMAVACSSLGQALSRYTKYQLLIDSSLNIESIDLGKSIYAKWWHGYSDEGALSEFGVAAFVSLYQALIGRDTAPERVELPHSPNGDPAIYQAIIGCPVQFNSGFVGIVLSKSMYAMAISSSDSYLRGLYDRQAKALLIENDSRDNDFLVNARRALQTAVQENQTSAQAVAKTLGMSLRTFYRQLQLNGLRYRSLLADIRFSLAKMYLKDESLALAEIALILGYSDQSAFSRAFVSWAGCTPSQYKLQLNA